MKNKAERLVEMALDLGGVPDWIDPERKRKIQRGEHDYAKNPAFPKEPGPGSFPPGENQPRPGQVGSYAELVASDVYPKIVRKLEQALGQRMPRGPHAPMQILQMLQRALQQAVQYEQGHEQELEQMAINIVLDLPEFQLAKENYEAGHLKIVAKLRPEVDPEGLNAEPEAPDEEKEQELQVAQIAQELDLEKEKRRMINMMIQGAAINKNHAYYMVQQQLNQLNPQLVNTYALLMSGGELAYWVVPEQMQQQMMGGGGGAAGVEKLEFDEDGTPIVHAQAIVFPVLIQELVKGIMEYLSYNDENDPSTQKYVHGQTDTLANEPSDINFGPAVWRQILRMIGDEQQYMPYIYRHITELPPEQFNTIMHQILRGEPEGRAFIQNLINTIKERNAAATEEPPYSEAGGPEEGPPEEDDSGEAWKKESKAQKRVSDLLD